MATEPAAVPVLPPTPQHSEASHSKVGEHQTARKMRRTHFILSYVNKEKVLEGFTGLLKLLGRKERNEGGCLRVLVTRDSLKSVIFSLPLGLNPKGWNPVLLNP